MPDSCPSGWRQFGNKCFHFNSIEDTFEATIEYCKKFIATLPTIHHKPEHEYISNLIFKVLNESDTWLGSTQVAIGSPDYRWLDESPFNYTRYGNGQPKCDKTKCCALVIAGDEKSVTQWKAEECSSKRRKLCQITLRDGGRFPRFLPNATAILKGPSLSIRGEIHFLQDTFTTLTIRGYVSGLKPGKHGIHISEFAATDEKCTTVGRHFNPTNETHGGKYSDHHHLGDLSNIMVASNGTAIIYAATKLSLMGDFSVVNRSIVINERADDLGQGSEEDSKITGHSGKPLACGTIKMDSN